MAGRKRQLLSFLLLFYGAFLAPSATAAAPLVGVLMSGNTPYFGELHQAFVETLQTGPTGARPKILLQRPFPDAIALRNAARKLIAAQVDVIVTYGSPATLAALQEKTRIPVVYGGVYNPENSILSGLETTGCGYKIPLSSLLRRLRELKPIATLSVIYTSTDDDSRRQAEELARLAAEQQISLNMINVGKATELDHLAKQITGDAVFLTGSTMVDLHLARTIAILEKRQLLSVSILPDLNNAGVILTLHQPPGDQGRKTAEMTLQVLAGRRVREIKPETLRNTELTFNLKEAKKLGLKIPFQLLAEATRVIK